MNALTETRAARPDWLRHSAYECGAIQDAWAEIFNPENERGEEVIGHYAESYEERDDAHGDGCHMATWRDLLGVEINDLNGTRYMSRAQLFVAGMNTARFDGWAEE